MLKIVFVVSCGGALKTLERFLESEGCRGADVRRERRERLCARVRERRSVARRAAVTSGVGGSPKMKNLMKAPMRITTESWPRRRPWVKERLRELAGLERRGGNRTRTRAWGKKPLQTF